MIKVVQSTVMQKQIPVQLLNDHIYQNGSEDTPLRVPPYPNCKMGWCSCGRQFATWFHYIDHLVGLLEKQVFGLMVN